MSRFIRSILAMIAVGLALTPRLLAVDYLYVSLVDDRVVRYDVSLASMTDVQNSMQVFVNSHLDNAIDLAFDSTGKLYAANYDNSTVTQFDRNGQYLSTIGASSGLQGVQGVAIDKFDQLYVSNAPINTISKFDTAGNLLSTISSQLSSPEGIAFDPAGNLYAANWSGSTISRFDSSGNYLSSITTHINGPLGLGFDSNGYLNVLNFHHLHNTVSVFDPSGTFVSTVASVYDDPARIAFDRTGNFYLTYNNSNVISKYNSAGVHQFSWNADNTVGGISFAPEPSTLLMSIVAAGVIAWKLRKTSARCTAGKQGQACRGKGGILLFH